MADDLLAMLAMAVIGFGTLVILAAMSPGEPWDPTDANRDI